MTHKRAFGLLWPYGDLFMNYEADSLFEMSRRSWNGFIIENPIKHIVLINALVRWRGKCVWYDCLLVFEDRSGQPGEIMRFQNMFSWLVWFQTKFFNLISVLLAFKSDGGFEIGVLCGDRFVCCFMQLGNLLEQGRITFAPNSTEVAGLVNYLLTENEVDDSNN